MGALSKDELIDFAEKHAGKFCSGSDGWHTYSGKIVGYCKESGHLILEYPGWRRLDLDNTCVCLIPGACEGLFVFLDLKLKELTEDERKLLKQLTQDVIGWEP